MKGLAVLFVILGTLALISAPNVQTDMDRARAVAENFARYRVEVNRAALASPPASGGSIDASSVLPSTWQALRTWENRRDGNNFYVFGSADAREVFEIRTLFRGSMAITVQDGTLPSFIPTDAVVSVIEVGS